MLLVTRVPVTIVACACARYEHSSVYNTVNPTPRRDKRRIALRVSGTDRSGFNRPTQLAPPSWPTSFLCGAGRRPRPKSLKFSSVVVYCLAADNNNCARATFGTIIVARQRYEDETRRRDESGENKSLQVKKTAGTERRMGKK